MGNMMSTILFINIWEMSTILDVHFRTSQGYKGDLVLNISNDNMLTYYIILIMVGVPS